MNSGIKQQPSLRVAPLRRPADRRWAARLMAGSEPWLTLGRNAAATLALLRNPARQCFVATVGRTRVSVLILAADGPLGGYLQAICVAPERRGGGLGTALVQWAEARLFARQPNVFLCVSSFNPGALRLYRRLGYRTVGRLRDYIIPGHDEILLRKTLGPLSAVSSAKLSRWPAKRTSAPEGMSLNR
ncbi:MAG: GNAT family N-acetyltransferase [Opitutales bacterium]